MLNDSNRNDFLFKDIKEYNKYLLVLIGVLIIVLTGIISYNFSNNSYAKWSSNSESKNTLKLSIKQKNMDKSGANRPLLASNMIPVYYDEANNTWKKADDTNGDTSTKWYDYDNKMWANAVTVTSTNRTKYLNASVGTEISMNDINTMWVWIPRYTYTYLNTNTPQSINIKFENDIESTGTIKCTDNVSGTSSTSETCTDTTNGGLKAGISTYTHPAFWWDKNDDSIRTEDEELTGIWVGKFEVSLENTCSECNLETLRPQIKPNAKSWESAQLATYFNGIYKMRENNNQYGFATTDETHMMKNMEWGAVTYLSHSKYGIDKEVAINSVRSHTTGCGPQSEGSLSSYNSCNEYNTALGQSASTTGNVTGIYDMCGGTYEYLMADMVYSNGQMMSGAELHRNFHSAFTGYLYTGGYTTGTYDFPSKRYYDKYSYGTVNTQYTRGKLGDATKEMAPTGTNDGSWYADNAIFPSSELSWFVRGGTSASSTQAGLFFFESDDGHPTNVSSRAVISNLK